jgi:transcriptional regulator with XRE-family HTH domain
MSATSLPARLREAREYVGLAVADAAAAAGMADPELDAIERGARPPDELELERLARAYGYARGHFARPPQPLDEGTVAVVARLGEAMSDHDRREAMLFAAYLRDAGED